MILPESNWNIPRYNLDYSSGRIFASQLDQTIVSKKYELYDLALATGQLEVDERGNPINPSAFALLADDTIFAYAFLHWDNKPVKLYYYQDALFQDHHPRIYIEIANQCGKSFFLQVQSCVEFLRDHGKNWTIMLVSRSKDQNMNNMQAIKKLLSDSGVEFTSLSDSMSVTERKTEQGYYNRIICTIAGESSLAFSPDHLFLDEFEFYKEEGHLTLRYYYDKIYDPRTQATNGRITICSNPNGFNFVSEDLLHRKIKTEYEFHTYNARYIDKPGASIDRWEHGRKYKTAIDFASTMGATRVASTGSPLTESDILQCVDDELDRNGFHNINDKRSWWFLDLGFTYDQSVLVGCYLSTNAKEETVYNFAVKCYPVGYDHSQMWGFEPGDEDSVPQIIQRHGGSDAVFDLDLTGKEGNELNAIRAGLTCTGVKMSGPFKVKWYERFISLAKQGRIKVQTIQNYIDNDNKNFAFQARSLKESRKTPDGRNRQYALYHHGSEKDHDDILDAIIGCLSLADQELTTVVSATLIENTKTVQAIDTESDTEYNVPSFHESLHGFYNNF